MFGDGEGKGRKVMDGMEVEVAVYIKFQKVKISLNKKGTKIM